MRVEQASDFERYVVLSNYTKLFSGSYPNFLRLKELMNALNQMVTKNNNTYTYYGELYVSSLTNPEISKIQSCLDLGVYNSSLEKIKHIFVDIGRRDF
jgi:thiaminase|tara:strand:+ start:299 stop:592 length:294 start_codon:yes stop_codon:yes gene_type:complete